MRVTVSRLWHNPSIMTTINDEGIRLEMNLEDFKKAIIKEFGSVTFVFTQKGFETKMDLAFENVIKGIKEESVKHV